MFIKFRERLLRVDKIEYVFTEHCGINVGMSRVDGANNIFIRCMDGEEPKDLFKKFVKLIEDTFK